jgi:hypothetical protein
MEEYYSILYTKETKNDIAEYLKDKEVIIVGPAPYLEGSNMGKLIDSFDVVVRIKSGYPIPNPLKKDIGARIDLWYTNLKAEQNHLNSVTFEEMEKNNLNNIIFPYPIKYERNDVFKTSMIRFIGLLQHNFKTGISVIQKHFKYRNKKCPFNISYDTSSLYFQNLEKIIGSRPTTGMLAIMDLLQYDIKNLQIVGFSFRHEVLMEQQKQSSQLNMFEGNPKKLFQLYSKYYKTNKDSIISWQKTLANKTHDLRKELIFMKRLRDLDKRIKVDTYLYKILDSVNF